MKTSLLLGLIVLTIAGCGVLQRAYSPIVTSTTTTNVINGVTVTNTVWQTNWAPNPSVVQGIGVATQVGGAINPIAGAVGTLLGLLYAAGSTVLNIKQAKDKKQFEEAGKVLVQNIDAGREVIKSLSPPETARAMGVPTPEEKFVEKIADKQEAAGVRTTVEKLRA